MTYNINENFIFILLNLFLIFILNLLNNIFNTNIDVNWIIFLSIIFFSFFSIKKKNINL